jgi:phage gp16-like protein
VNIFARIRESGLRGEYTDMRVAHGDAMVAHKRRCEYILRAKKRLNNKYLYDK